MSEKHLPYIGGNFDRIVFDRDGSTWVREQLDTRYYELFGTPERAARTLANNCHRDGCIACAAMGFDCGGGDYDALLEWLREEGETE